MPIQQMLLGVGAVATKTYVDDIFSTYVYTGDDASGRTVTNGINLSNEGGMVWIKNREQAENHAVFDTARGTGKKIETDGNGQEQSGTSWLSAFNSNGFTVGGSAQVNKLNIGMSSWTFRKAPGFFDVVSFSSDENYSTKTINHNLGSVPGFIVIKKYSVSYNWIVWHRDLDTNKYLLLNSSNAASTDSNQVITNATSTQFTIGADHNNGAGDWIAYVFAGGESTAATARSVAFSSTGSNDGAKSLTIASSSDTDLGSGDFTLECWFKDDAGTTEHDTIFALENYGEGGSDSGPGNSFSCYVYDKGIKIFDRTSGGFSLKTNLANTFYKSQWTHFAWTRSGSGSNNNTIWINGNSVAQFTGTLAYTDGQDFFIGGNDYARTGTPDRYGFNGNISNVRITKGQAVYTSAFKPSTTPMTTTTGGATASNVKVICCNNSSITGSSVTSGTITSTNTPTASTDSPFDDPAGFVFGDAGDQNVIKCGSWTQGSGMFTAYLGWEPQWIMHKRSDGTGSWEIFDTMRGWGETGFKRGLKADVTDAEDSSLTDDSTPIATGFTFDPWYGNGEEVIFVAIRRPDGYVGKPPELGTDVFAMDTSSASSVIPTFDSTFPVDFGLKRKTASTDHWLAGYRLLGQKSLSPDRNNSETDSGASLCWDSNLGFGKTFGTLNQGWMWKRHAGFTVCAWEGDGVIGRQIAHDMNKIPEMIWLKKRTGTARNWPVYHKGLDGGSSPEEKVVWLNLTNAESDSLESWNNTAPTSTHFTIHGTANEPNTNTDGEDYIAMLFASVDGISKVGSYDGDSSNNISLTLGFTPRLLIIKSTTDTTGWVVMDSLRDSYAKQLQLNSSAAQNTDSNHLIVSMNSTTTVLEPNKPDTSASNEKYIYYAHA